MSNDSHIADKLLFNAIAQSSYPIRLDGWDVVVSEDKKSITIMNGPEKGTEIRYDEIGDYSKPQMKDYKATYLVYDEWI